MSAHYEYICDIFCWLAAPLARTSLCTLFDSLARQNAELTTLLPILQGLNAVLAGRADLEPNFDARFQVILGGLYASPHSI